MWDQLGPEPHRHSVPVLEPKTQCPRAGSSQGLSGRLGAVSAPCPHRVPVRVCPDPLFSCGPQSHWIRGTPVTPFYLSHMIKGPNSTYSHMLGCWGSGLQRSDLGATLGHNT